MSERKYRQHGYQDEPRQRDSRPPQRPREAPEGPRTPNLMASQIVSRCTRCGNLLTGAIDADSRCTRCGIDLHSCVQCVSFNPGVPLECMQPIRVGVSPKDVKNACSLFEARSSIERQTGSTPAVSARQAFDDLFK